ncbi:MAG: sulfite exporter TauE/SafE family protein [Caulobacterales bacterium]
MSLDAAAPHIWWLLAALLPAGLFAGLIAGLFGVGGGVVIVPVLYQLLTALGFGDTALHMAVATSLSTIIATSFSSLNAHRKKGAVDEAVLRSWTPWVAFGAVGGAALAGLMSARGLELVFGVLGLLVAAQFLFAREDWRLAAALPTGAVRAGIGVSLGGVSALMGIGGGAFGATLMTLCGRPIHQAVATASGFGAAIGIPAALALIMAGWFVPGRPPLSLGYVNAPAFAAIGALTVAMAPVGARLAHRLDRSLLKRLFGAMFAVIAVKMLFDAVR